MQNEWWQRRWILGLGVLGSVLIIILPLVGGIIWPLYKPATAPIAILMAQDADFNIGFKTVQLIGMVLILMMLLALRQLYKHEASLKLQRATMWLFVGVLLLAGLNYLLPLQTVVEGAVFNVTWSVRDIVALVVNLFLAVALWRYSSAVANHGATSLANVMKLMTILFLLFNALEYGVILLNWPLVGLMDLLSYDSLMLGFMYLSWYYMRQAA